MCKGAVAQKKSSGGDVLQDLEKLCNYSSDLDVEASIVDFNEDREYRNLTFRIIVCILFMVVFVIHNTVSMWYVSFMTDMPLSINGTDIKRPSTKAHCILSDLLVMILVLFGGLAYIRREVLQFYMRVALVKLVKDKDVEIKNDKDRFKAIEDKLLAIQQRLPSTSSSASTTAGNPTAQKNESDELASDSGAPKAKQS